MKVLVYGYGLNEGGYNCALYFLKKGCQVRVTDLRNEASLGESIQNLKALGVEIVSGAHRVEDFQWADLVIKTPAISPDNPFLDYAKAIQCDFSYLFENENVAKTKLICITGRTNKTITTEAVCHALNAMGKKARTCGSIDSPVFKELENWENSDIPDYLICKLSSWQVRDIFLYSEGFIPSVDLALITEINLNEKYDLFSNSTKYLLCSQENKAHIRENLNINMRRVSLIENNTKSCSKDLPDNLKNAFAVLYRLGFKAKDINNSLKSFKGIPHRMEIVKSLENLLVIDDSSSIIPDAVGFSMQNFKNQPVNIICGGSNKRLEAEPMLETCKKANSVTLLDGTFTQKKLIPLLKKNNIQYAGPFERMQDAVEAAMKNVDNDKKMLQVLVLCPGAPATEFFENEYDRGTQFKSFFK